MTNKPNQNGYIVHEEKKSVTTNEAGDTVESVVYTDPVFAKRIVDYFEPQFKSTDTFLDPCRGRGAFYDCLPANKDYCEIMEGKDFFQYQNKVDWILMNAPWIGKVYAPFTNHCFELSTNVVSLVKLFGGIGTYRRLRDAKNHNMEMKEIIITDWKSANFTYIDGSKKNPEGFVLSIIHWQKNWQNGCQWTYWT